MHVIRNKNGEIVNSSRNMRGIRRVVGKQLVKSVAIDHLPADEGKLCILFDNGDSYETNFASFEVLKHCLRNWRNLYGALLTIDGNRASPIVP